MDKERALQYWINRYNSAKDYSDIHWDAEERHEHRDYVDAILRDSKAAFVTLGVYSEEGWEGIDGWPLMLAPTYWARIPMPPEE